MVPDTNMRMAEALRLTRAGRLTEATEVLQRGLASAGTAATEESTVAQRFGDPGLLRRPMPGSRAVGRPGGARSSSGGAPVRGADAPGGEFRHLTHTESAGTRSYRPLHSDWLRG